ncbi:MAG: hypothetical protein AAGL66_13825, partial [Pseudomonadota bacterium]
MLAAVLLGSLPLISVLSGCDSRSARDDTSTTETMEMQADRPGPPVAKIENVVDTHWGVEVDDPYRYMEEVDDPYVREWFEGQAAYAEGYFAALAERESLFDRLVEMDQGAPFRTYSVKEFPGGDVFYMRREAGENLAKLYIHEAGADEPRLLVDPEAF